MRPGSASEGLTKERDTHMIPDTAARDPHPRWPENGTPEDGTETTVDQLYDELQSMRVDSDDADVRLPSEQRSEAVLDRVRSILFDDADFRFEGSTVKGDLDEILLLLVALRSSGTHGKGLMEDLAAVFDTHISPGTLYPQLHELENEGLLRVQELVRTKEYRVHDDEALAERVTAAMEQHLVMGFFFRAALAELS